MNEKGAFQALLLEKKSSGGGSGGGTAASVTVQDVGGYYEGNNVEAVLQEIGATLKIVPKNRGFVNYISDLPLEGNEIGDMIIVLYEGTEGTVFYQEPFLWLTVSPGVIPPQWYPWNGLKVSRVNGVEPDQYGNLTLNSVPYAGNLISDRTQEIVQSFIARTTGGSVSVSESGDAFLARVQGSLSHVGRVPASMVVTPYPTEGSDFGVTIDQTVFATKFPLGVTTTFTYTADGWTLNGEVVDVTEYGAEITGTPLEGDYFTAAYTPANPGVITPAVFEKLVSTGNNLYNDEVGYARTVGAYTNDYGIIGTYTSLAWAETPDGDTTEITVVDGKFNLNDIADGKDGYIIVTGGDDTTTMIWQCWTDMPATTFEEYAETSVSMPTLTNVFTDGVMCAVGDTADEIDFATGTATQRIGIIPFDAETLQEMLLAQINLDYDADYIYYELETPIVEHFTAVNQYTAYDHGIEYFDGTTVPLTCDVLYGVNIVAYILHDLAEKAVVRTTSSTTVHLSNNNTTVITGAPTSVIATLDEPEQGLDFICGLNFKCGSTMVFQDNAPSGFSIVWEDEPTWTAGKVYEIIYRCLWLADGNGDTIISAKYAEVTPAGVSA